MRTPTQQGRWAVGILVSSLTPEAVLALTAQPPELITDPLAVLLAYVAFYDQRGGGVETAFREDKQGLGLTKRAKRRLPAQELLVGLSTLAHNVLVWARRWLCPAAPRLAQVGLLRLVRDVLHISGFVDFDATTGRPVQVILNGAAPGAGGIARALHHLLAPEQIGVTVGVT